MPNRTVLSTASTLVVGLAMGAAMGLWAGSRGPEVRAGGSDRLGDSALASGSVAVQVNPNTRVAFHQEALYFLDYRGGRLLATVPELRSSTGGTRVLNPFASRDLVADFRLPHGVTPQFLMAPAETGVGGMGWAPLFVFETSTRQVAAYRVQPKPVGPGNDGRPEFELLEVEPLP